MKIAITGRKRSGKDTVVDLIIEHLESQGNSVSRLALGDSLKEFAHAIYFDYPTDNKPRELYQFMNIMREFDEDVWVKHLDRKITSSEADSIIITDLRQQNELDYAKEQGFTIIKVESDKEIRKQRTLNAGEEWSEEHENHPSEKDIDNLEEDILIYNNTNLADLEENVRYTLGLMPW